MFEKVESHDLRRHDGARLAKCQSSVLVQLPVSEGLRIPRSGPLILLMLTESFDGSNRAVALAMLRSWRPDLSIHTRRPVAADQRIGLEGVALTSREADDWLALGHAVACWTDPQHSPVEWVSWADKRRAAVVAVQLSSVQSTADMPPILTRRLRLRGLGRSCKRPSQAAVSGVPAKRR